MEKEMLTENCGVFGVYNHPESVYLTFLGLHSLQHRGQESVGVVYYDTKRFYQLKGVGLVNEFVKKISFDKHKGIFSIGHIRYSTTGSLPNINIQPIVINSHKGVIGVAHNGNLINAFEIREKLRRRGAIFQTSSDSEVVLHLLAHSKEKNIKDSIISSLKKLKGSFSFLFITEEGIYATRDEMGNRPLCIGKLGKSFVISSEDCALKIVGAKFLREIKPAELLKIDKTGVHSYFFKKSNSTAFCIFELIYFARPDSNIFGISVNQFREECGRQLAKESPAEADFVIAVPDSGNYAALGYSRESGIHYEIGLVRNHYIGRTFIQSTQSTREAEVKLKLMPVENIIKNKRIVIVDDSIVRGTTSKKIMEILRNAGAKEIHFRIASPPYRFPCFYGIDTPNQKEFLAYKMNIENIRKFIGVDSLHYLSIEGLKKVVGKFKNSFCYACFNGDYPQKPQYKLKKDMFENEINI